MSQTSSETKLEPNSPARLAVCIVVGVLLGMVPAPSGLAPEAWHVFAIFAATILSFILRPLPMGACVLVGLLAIVAAEQAHLVGSVWSTGEVDNEKLNQGFKDSFKHSLYGFSDSTVWLVVAAFLISGAMIHSQLGRRIALMMVARFGRTTLGLGYAIAGAELMLAPFIPSNTARGGGLMAPIVNSLAGVLGSTPFDRPRRAGEYLMLCGAHLNLVTAAMFMTGMAANPLVSKAAKDVLGVEFGWGTWLLGSIVPGLLSLALLPRLLYWLAPPELAESQQAQASASKQLAEMGPWTRNQITMAIVLLSMLVLWATVPLQEKYLAIGKIPTTLVAVTGVMVLVVLRVLPYKELVGNAAAWDTLLWLGGLVTMADMLKSNGFVHWFADLIKTGLGDTPAMVALVVLALIYFYSMYAFSMLTGHILAFAGVFFGVALAVGAPPMAMVALIAYFSNLCGCTTHYSTGPVVIYYGLGYVPISRWFKIGFVISLFHLVVWLGAGMLWWYLLGWMKVG